MYKPNWQNYLLQLAFIFVCAWGIIRLSLLIPENLGRGAKGQLFLFGIFFTDILLSWATYITFIQTFGFKVSLKQDSIEVTTLLRTKALKRTDIRSYYYRWGSVGRGGNWNPYVVLISKKPLDDVSSVSVTPNALFIPLMSITRDNEFDDWIKSFPCETGLSPLPPRSSKLN